MYTALETGLCLRLLTGLGVLSVVPDQAVNVLGRMVKSMNALYFHIINTSSQFTF